MFDFFVSNDFSSSFILESKYSEFSEDQLCRKHCSIFRKKTVRKSPSVKPTTIGIIVCEVTEGAMRRTPFMYGK